jgi:Cu/Ag efflux pump CusA
MSSYLFAPLKPYDRWPAGRTKEKLIEELNKEFADEVPGATYNFSQYIQDNLEEALSGVKGANSVKILGRNLAPQEQLASQIAHEMQQVRGITDLGIFHVLGQPNLNIKVDRDKAARYGLNTGDVNTTIQAALGGTVATTLLEGDRQFNVTVRRQNSIATVWKRYPISRSPAATAATPTFRCASLPTSRSIPAHPTSITKAALAIFRSSSVFAVATSAAQAPRRRHGLPRT